MQSSAHVKKNKPKIFFNINVNILIVIFLLLGIGVLNLYSASAYRVETGLALRPFFFKQLIWGGIGIVVFSLMLFGDYRKLKQVGWFIYAFAVLSLGVVFITGKVVYGARRWIHLGFFNFQPSELAKISIIILIAHILSEENNVLGWKTLAKIGLILVLPVALIIKQPDLGTALLIIMTVLGMLCFKGIKGQIVKCLLICAPLVLSLFWFNLHPYQKNRILTFLNPARDPLGAGYHIIQSEIAIGSGGMWGKGFLRGSQSQLRFLPEKHTDFAFAVFAEEWGFVGSMCLLFLFCWFLYLILQVALEAKDSFGRYLVIGIFCYFGLQIVINIGMVLGLMPVVGIPLPFISYGGTSLVVNFILLGLVVNVSMRRFIFKNTS